MSVIFVTSIYRPSTPALYRSHSPAISVSACKVSFSVSVVCTLCAAEAILLPCQLVQAMTHFPTVETVTL